MMEALMGKTNILISDDSYKNIYTAVNECISFLHSIGIKPGNNLVAINDLCQFCFYQIRNLQNSLQKDTHGYIEYLPDNIIENYVIIFKFLYGELKNQNQMHTLLKNRITRSGFINKSIFPDWKGGYFINSYGSPGVWLIHLKKNMNLHNRKIIQIIDSICFHLEQIYSKYEMKRIFVKLRIVNQIPISTDFTLLQKNDFFALSCDEIIIDKSLVEKNREDQIEILKKLQWDKAKKIVLRSPILKSSKQENKGNSSKNVLVISFSTTKGGRGRDYFHNKSNYRIEAYCEDLSKRGVGTKFLSFESPDEYQDILKNISAIHNAIIVFSLYQIKKDDIDLMHLLASDIRKLKPDAVIGMEGPATMHAKQLLAISPQVDFFVRGEIDEFIQELCYSPNVFSNIEESLQLVNNVTGGIMIRGKTFLIVSNLDQTVINTHMKMVEPTRRMTSVWYTEHGCPHNCAFCRKDTGSYRVGRGISAERRIKWMINRLRLELEDFHICTISEICKILLSQAKDGNVTLLDKIGIKFRQDTFIGVEKVEIIIVSENSLVDRDVVIRFFSLIKRFGLQKYFKIKLADVTLSSLISGGVVDFELIDLLKDAGVYFIGIGTDNLSDDLLVDFNKSNYDFDSILAVNKYLFLKGFSSRYIRHNLILSSPESDLSQIKTSLLLYFLAPVYNSHYLAFANGWGNSRNSKVHAIEGSLFKARDVYIYSLFYKYDIDQNLGDEYVYFKNHIIAKDTPEYSLREESTPLFYRDERIYKYCSDFAWPHFYRYKLFCKLLGLIGEMDFKRAINTWETSDSVELSSLVKIVSFYQTNFKNFGFLEVVYKIKIHMIVLEIYSFADFLHIIETDKGLPTFMNIIGVDSCFSMGDELTMPGHFMPLVSLEYFAKAHFLAKAAVKFRGNNLLPSSTTNQVTAFIHILSNIYMRKGSLEIGDKKKIVSNICKELVKEDATREIFIDISNELLDEYQWIIESIASIPFVERMAYPDQQVFEYLEYLNLFSNKNDLFALVVREMNQGHQGFSASVKNVIINYFHQRVIEFSDVDYEKYVQVVTSYKNLGIFGNAGVLFGLRSTNVETILNAVNRIITHLENDNNNYLLLPILFALQDLPTLKNSNNLFIICVSTVLIKKICGILNKTNNGFVFLENSHICFFERDINWKQALELSSPEDSSIISSIRDCKLKDIGKDECLLIKISKLNN